MKETAKLFWSGRSQAVRLPKESRFEGQAVRIRREGKAVILEPVAQDRGWLDDNLGSFNQDMIDATEEEMPQQERPRPGRETWCWSPATWPGSRVSRTCG